jgi:small subunit ribosomal protein S2
VLEGKASAPNAASVREEEFADAAAAEEAKPARRAPAKKGAKKGDEASA